MKKRVSSQGEERAQVEEASFRPEYIVSSFFNNFRVLKK